MPRQCRHFIPYSVYELINIGIQLRHNRPSQPTPVVQSLRYHKSDWFGRWYREDRIDLRSTKDPRNNKRYNMVYTGVWSGVIEENKEKDAYWLSLASLSSFHKLYRPSTTRSLGWAWGQRIIRLWLLIVEMDTPHSGPNKMSLVSWKAVQLSALHTLNHSIDSEQVFASVIYCCRQSCLTAESMSITVVLQSVDNVQLKSGE